MKMRSFVPKMHSFKPPENGHFGPIPEKRTF